MTIPRTFITELVDRADIVDIIGTRVNLKKRGANFIACCPFHNEKTPSFTVSQSKQFYHCFGCGVSGNVIGFLMDYDRLDFVEAVETLAAHLGLTVPREQGRANKEQQDNRDHLYALMTKVNQYYQTQLWRHPEAEAARDYLRQRGLTKEVIIQFQLGFAPSAWRNLNQTLGDNQQLRQQLTKTGMLIQKDQNVYDRFRNRIMFPIHDRRGRIIGFGGRALSDDNPPKYLNSPETPIFHKGNELYGWYQARQGLRHNDSLIIVEGYMDVIALAQFGITNAIATLGTAATSEHIKQLTRQTQNIIFCFDGDNAGRQAAWRALENCLPVVTDGVNIQFMFLPDGQDPDSMVRDVGKDAFLQRLQQATRLSDFMFEHLVADIDLKDIEGRARLAKNAAPLIAKMPNSIIKQMIQDQLAKSVRLDREHLHKTLDIMSPVTKARPVNRYAQQARINQSPVRMAITLLIQYPELISELEATANWQNLRHSGMPLLLQVIEIIAANPHISTGGILEHFRY